jgi:hypothetical protein
MRCQKLYEIDKLIDMRKEKHLLFTYDNIENLQEENKVLQRYNKYMLEIMNNIHLTTLEPVIDMYHDCFYESTYDNKFSMDEKKIKNLINDNITIKQTFYEFEDILKNGFKQYKNSLIKEL